MILNLFYLRPWYSKIEVSIGRVLGLLVDGKKAHGKKVHAAKLNLKMKKIIQKMPKFNLKLLKFS